MQKLRGLIAAAIVGVPLGAFLFYSLHATVEIAAIVASGVGLAIFAVVATGADAHGAAADEAWRKAAPDLPPASDRVALERTQAAMPGPEKARRPGQRARDDRHDVQSGEAGGSEVQPR